jgi:hypothetical protein
MLSIALTILSGTIPFLLIGVDILCYHVTDQSYDFFHSNLTRVDPPNMYKLKVSGNGFMSELFSNLLDVFVPLSSIKKNEIWRDCFEEPNPPDYVLFQLMFLLYVVAFVLCFVQVYTFTWLQSLISRPLDLRQTNSTFNCTLLFSAQSQTSSDSLVQ